MFCVVAPLDHKYALPPEVLNSTESPGQKTEEVELIAGTGGLLVVMDKGSEAAEQP